MLTNLRKCSLFVSVLLMLIRSILSEISCDFPEATENGIIKELESTNLTTFPHHFEITYVCNIGYALYLDNSWRYCDNGKWSAHTPSCSEIRCPDPGVPDHGVRKGDSFVFGAIVIFSCLDGYRLLGSSERECLAHGEWSGELARCDTKGNYCPNPGTPINGIKSRNDYNMGDSVYFACNLGHLLIGSEVRECMPDRTWSGEETKCINPRFLEYKDYELTPIYLKSYLNHKAEEKKQDLRESKLTNYEGYRNCRSNNRPARLVVYFAFDVSRSMGEENFQKSIVFAKAIVRKFQIGDSLSGAIIGAFTFGSKIDIGFPPLIPVDDRRLNFLNYEEYAEYVNKGLNNLTYTGGSSSTESALEFLSEMIAVAYTANGKYSLTSVVFILSNGQGNTYSFPKIEADKLKNENVEIYCIGVTEDLSMTPLRNIASDPKEKHIFTMKKFNFLNWLVEDIRKGTIGSSVTITYPRDRLNHIKPSSLDRSNGRLFLYFVFDDSRNTGEHYFNKAVQFAKGIVKKVGIFPGGHHASVLTFGSKTNTSFSSDKYRYTKEFIEALDNLKYSGGELTVSSTDIRKMVYLDQRHGYSVMRVIFILINGPSTFDFNTRRELYYVKHFHWAEIFCIGMSGEASTEFLHRIASNPKEEHMYILENYPTMSWLIHEITQGKRDYSQCGLGHENIYSVKIIGGRNVTEKWPWMAALYFIVDRSHKMQCGGSIIHESYILTAAHCMYDKGSLLRRPSDIIVKLGLTNLQNEAFLQVPEVIRVIPHPRYRDDRNFYDYDIALLHLKYPIRFNAYVRPICLPPLGLAEDSPLYNTTKLGMAIGWGHEEIVRPQSYQRIKSTDHLKEITLPIETRAKCKRSLRDYGAPPTVFTTNMFCAGDGHRGNDTCYGDSGGPFMQWQRNSYGDLYWTQVGIVSWGIGCGVANTYGFYTHVQRLRSWIDESLQSAPKELN